MTSILLTMRSSPSSSSPHETTTSRLSGSRWLGQARTVHGEGRNRKSRPSGDQCRNLSRLVAGYLVFALLTSSLFADSPRTDPPKPVEKSRRSYLGRVLAQPMSHLGASWLVRPERDDEENASESFVQLKLADGMTVCDLGCGNGYWTLPMARKVGKEGKVYAVDIQPEMLRKLQVRADKEKIKNIELVRGDIDDPRLPENQIDLLLMVDVYHEFSHPESMLWAIRRSLTENGVVALLEYREEDPEVPIKPLHKMSKNQIMKEYQKNGFKLVREYNQLPWQHLMFFARDDSPTDAIEPVPTQQVLEDLE